MLFDTDILIWVQRGNKKIANLIDEEEDRLLSVQSYMELLQGTRNKKEHRCTKDFLHEYSFKIIPLTQNIGHRAAIYVEEYALSNNVRSGDALIAATAVENDYILCTTNEKHFRCIKDLRLKVVKP